METFEDRFNYLAIGGQVGERTFGFDRWLNQAFYHSYQWKHVRDLVIIRDNSCDLGFPGYEIYEDLLVHHINPVAVADLTDGHGWVLDPNFLITTSRRTHNAIHYGDASLLPRPVIARQPGDTNLW